MPADPILRAFLAHPKDKPGAVWSLTTSYSHAFVRTPAASSIPADLEDPSHAAHMHLSTQILYCQQSSAAVNQLLRHHPAFLAICWPSWPALLSPGSRLLHVEVEPTRLEPASHNWLAAGKLTTKERSKGLRQKFIS